MRHHLRLSAFICGSFPSFRIRTSQTPAAFQLHSYGRMSDTHTKPAEVKKKSNPIVLIALVAVLVGGGGFAAWKFLWHPAATAEAKADAKDDAPRKKSKKKQVKSV